jgi:lysophospholipase L1-like esterase
MKIKVLSATSQLFGKAMLALGFLFLCEVATFGRPAAFELLRGRFVDSSCSNPRILVVGSSTANGVGASTWGLSWQGRLSAAAVPLGVQVINRSRDGVGSSYVLANIERLVDETNPDFVIIATNIYNDGFEREPGIATARFLEQVTVITQRVVQKGALPILVTMHPSTTYTLEHRRWLRILHRSVVTLGFPVLDFASAVTAIDGGWLRGSNRDQIHPNDLGHALMAASIDPTMFLSLCSSAVKIRYKDAITGGGDNDRDEGELWRIEVSRLRSQRGEAILTRFGVGSRPGVRSLQAEIADQSSVLGFELSLEIVGEEALISVLGPQPCYLRGGIRDGELLVGFSVDKAARRFSVEVPGGLGCHFTDEIVSNAIQLAVTLSPGNGQLPLAEVLHYGTPILPSNSIMSGGDSASLGSLWGWWRIMRSSSWRENLWFGTPALTFY